MLKIRTVWWFHFWEVSSFRFIELQQFSQQFPEIFLLWKIIFLDFLETKEFPWRFTDKISVLFLESSNGIIVVFKRKKAEEFSNINAPLRGLRLLLNWARPSTAVPDRFLFEYSKHSVAFFIPRWAKRKT